MSRPPHLQADFRSGTPPVLCATCGHTGGLGAIAKSLAASDLQEEQVAWVAGAGCAGKLPQGLRGYRLELPAGMAVAAAVGLAGARRDLKVLAVTGDMEAQTSGLPGLFAAGNRNAKMVYVILDNDLGASAALTPLAAGIASDFRRRSCVELCLQAGATFVAAGLAADMETASKLLSEALKHEGFACVVLRSACTTFHRAADDLSLQAASRLVPSSHPVQSVAMAAELARQPGVHWNGILLKQAAPAAAAAKS